MTKTAALAKDANGFAPTQYLGCGDDECAECGGIGWILCDHEGAEIEKDPGNEDGHEEWCTRCSAPADDKRTWTSCPNRG